MGEEEVTLIFDFYSEKISVKVDPALLDAVEQDMKLYGLTHEEIICTGYSRILSKYSLDEIQDLNLDEFGIAFPAKEYEQEMSISEFIDIESTDCEIRSKQLDLLYNRKRNLEFFNYVNERASSAINKRLERVLKNQKE